MRVFESTADGLVPLAERFRGLVLVRLAIAAVMLAGAVLLPAGPGGTPLALLAVVTAGWLGLSAAAAVAWRVSHSRRLGVALLSLLLLPDGLYLAWATYGTGGVASPLRALILLHLVAVTLLASFRTGMKLALWHSLLLLSAFHAQDAGLRALGGRPLDLVAGGLERAHDARAEQQVGDERGDARHGYWARVRRNSSRTDCGRPHMGCTSTRPSRSWRSASSPSMPASSSIPSVACTTGAAAAWPKRCAHRMRQCQSWFEYGWALQVTMKLAASM